MFGKSLKFALLLLPSLIIVGNYPALSKCLEDKCYKFGKESQRAPSWCDRILYYTPYDPNAPAPIITHQGRARDGTMITCSEYNSYDFSQIMAMSDHSAVFGTYNIHLH